MRKGQKRIFVTPLDSVSSSDKDGVGNVRREGDDEYIYCKGVASTTTGDVVVIDEAYETALLTTALGASPARLGVAMADIVADSYGWYQIRGIGAVNALASAAASAALYTSATSGSVDDTATDEHAIIGLFLTETVGGADAIADCFMVYPMTVPQLD